MQEVRYRKNSVKRSFLNRVAKRLQIGPYFFVFTLILCVSLVTVMTLTNSTKQVTKGYQVNALDDKHSELVKNREVMDMRISDARSLNFIQNSPQVRYMVSPDQLVYVSGETAIASAL